MEKCEDDVRGVRNWRQTILSLSARWAAMCNKLSLSKYPTKYREKLSSRWKVNLWTNLFCQILTENWKHIWWIHRLLYRNRFPRHKFWGHQIVPLRWHKGKLTVSGCSTSKHIIFKWWKRFMKWQKRRSVNNMDSCWSQLRVRLHNLAHSSGSQHLSRSCRAALLISRQQK